jgi:hypothetical protein
MYTLYMKHESEGMLKYIFIADVERWTETLYKSLEATDPSATNAEDALGRLLNFFEEALDDGDEYVHDLIGAGFMEMMDPASISFTWMRSHMGPKSQRELDVTFAPPWHRTDPNVP